MKILVTGGAGFIGSHIVDQLLESQHDVVVLDNLSKGSQNNLPKGVRLVVKDVTSNLDAFFAKERFHIVVHQAAQASVPYSIQNSTQNPIYDMQVNLQGLLRVLEASRKSNVSKIIFSSSAAVYGKPTTLPISELHSLSPISPSGLSKKMAEEFIQMYHKLYGIQYTIFRYGNVYGPRQSFTNEEEGVITKFIRELIGGGTPTIFGDGTDTRDYVFVEDVARANVLALEKGDGEILNVATETAVNLNDLVEILAVLLEKEVHPIYSYARLDAIRHSILSNSKIKSVLEWKPQMQLAEGIRKTIEWLQTYD